MKKNLGKILAMAVVAVMMMATVAFADAAVGDPAVDGNVVTATLSGLTAGEEATILVVKDGVDPSALTSSNTSDIIYIDQVTVDEDGNASFDFDASAAVVADATADIYVDIYCGYTNMTGDALATTAKVFTYEVSTPDYVVGDIDGNGTADSEDAIYLFNYTTFPEFFPTNYPESLNFDGLDDVTADDAIYLFNYMTFPDFFPLYPEY